MTAIPCAVCDHFVPLVDGLCSICARMQRDLEASGHKATFVKLDAPACAECEALRAEVARLRGEVAKLLPPTPRKRKR